jgi:proline racemase
MSDAISKVVRGRRRRAPVADQTYEAVDSHTEGMPTRVITGGVGVLPGATMAERRRYVETEADELRRLLMHEPRGHSAMSGALLQPPCRADADWGVVFIEVSGCLPMCGHGTIGVATVLVETGMVEVVEPETVVRLDVPAGLVEARVAVSGGRATAVTIRNVESFFAGSFDGYDLAFGGNFYAIADAAEHGLTVAPEHAGALIAAGLELMAAVPEPVHPRDSAVRGLKHVIWLGEDRSAVAIAPGWLDRSPCGTGTSARMAQLHARGALALGEPFAHRSIIGTEFTGRLVAETEHGVIPEITGRAWITGTASSVLHTDDPFPAGFHL